MLVLGIDIGSSFIKTALYDLDAIAILQIDKYPTPGYLAHDGIRSEIAVDQLAACIRQQIAQTAAAYPLDGIIFSAQMHGLLLKDKKGKNLTRFMTWQDSSCLQTRIQGHNLIDYIQQKLPAAVLQRTGVQLKSSHTLCKLVALAQERPWPGARMTLLGEAVIEELTGQVSAMSPSMAASTGLYDLVSSCWHDELMERLDLSSVQLPPLQQGQRPVAELQLKQRSMPIYSTIGDHQAAVLGSLPGAHDVVLNIGTGSQASYLDDSITFGHFETRPYFDNSSLRCMTHMPAGRALSTIMDFVMDIGRQVFQIQQINPELLWNRIGQMIESGDLDSGGLAVDLSFYQMSPASQGGSITGIRENNLQIHHLLVAAYRAMAHSYQAALQDIHRPEEKISQLICSGGLVRKSSALLTCIREAAAMPVRLSPFSEDVLVGLMRLAYWFSGRYPSVEATKEAMARLQLNSPMQT